ncbi:condensation domain-containing protein [Streptomyces albidoflavus]
MTHGADPSARNARSQITPKVFSIKGPLDTEALGAAVRSAARAHSAFRTSFAPSASPGRSLQILSAETQFEVVKVVGPESGALETAVATAAVQPFDIEGGPLGRLVIGTLAPEQHIVAVAIEHLVSDGWGFELMLKGIQSFYNALVTGTEPPSLPPSLHHLIAVGEREWLASAEGRNAGRFWRDELGDVGSMVPLCVPGAEIPTGLGRVRSTWHTRYLDTDTVSAINVAARKGGMPIGALYTGSVAEAVRRNGVGDELSVISPTINRHDAQSFNSISWASNIVTFRFRRADGPEGHLGATAVREGYLRAMVHSRYPIHQIDLDLSPEAFGAVNTTIPQLYLDTGVPGKAFELHNIEILELPPPRHQVPLGLAVWIRPTERKGLKVELAHPAAYVSERVGACIADTLIDLLKGVER